MLKKKVALQKRKFIRVKRTPGKNRKRIFGFIRGLFAFLKLPLASGLVFSGIKNLFTTHKTLAVELLCSRKRGIRTKTRLGFHLGLIILVLILTLIPMAENMPFNFLDQTHVVRAQSVLTSRDSSTFQRPVEGGYRSQGFYFFHPAWDLAVPYGSQIKPIASGKVEFSGMMYDGHGRTVIIDHGDGLKSLYAHMSETHVFTGDEIDQNKVIGNVGLTGSTSGPHLHLEILDSGKGVNPADFLPKED